QAGDPGLAYEYAAAAAAEAAALSAHGEALGLYRRAVRSLPAGLPALDRAALFTALGDESAATDDNTAAAQAYQTAPQLAIGAGPKASRPATARRCSIPPSRSARCWSSPAGWMRAGSCSRTRWPGPVPPSGRRRRRAGTG